MNISTTLTYLRPGEKWTLRGTEYENLEWEDETTKPTMEELEAAWIVLNTPDPEEARKAELQRISDAMVKSGAWESTLFAVMQVNIGITRQKYPTQTSALTDDQIIAAVTNPASPYYNANAAKAYQYYVEIKDVT